MTRPEADSQRVQAVRGPNREGSLCSTQNEELVYRCGVGRDVKIPRLFAEYQREREVGKWIEPVGAPVRFDVTAAMMSMPLSEIVGLRDDTESTDALARLCPAAALHDGPFRVAIEQALQRWLGDISEMIGEV